LEEFARVLKPGRHCYVMTNHESLFEFRGAWPDSLQWHKPLVWDKRVIGMGYHYRAQYEFVIFASAGRRTSHRLNNLGTGDVLSVRALRAGRGPAYYPSEKPVELMAILLGQSCVPGEVVCDPFFGSGSVAMAAEHLGVEFWGCDAAPKAHEYLAARQAEAQRQQSLFTKE
jgi:site-specific DNA-methyltransferase (adenine-specific)